MVSYNRVILKDGFLLSTTSGLPYLAPVPCGHPGHAVGWAGIKPIMSWSLEEIAGLVPEPVATSVARTRRLTVICTEALLIT